MNQATLKKSDGYANLPASALSEYLRNAGDMLAEESALLGHVISSIMASEGHLTNKAIIARLITLLESSDDVVACDIIRKTLEIVVDHTIDDI